MVLLSAIIKSFGFFCLIFPDTRAFKSFSLLDICSILYLIFSKLLMFFIQSSLERNICLSLSGIEDDLLIISIIIFLNSLKSALPNLSDIFFISSSVQLLNLLTKSLTIFSIPCLQNLFHNSEIIFFQPEANFIAVLVEVRVFLILENLFAKVILSSRDKISFQLCSL